MLHLNDSLNQNLIMT